jgi:PAS domain S-box-containing protein
LLIPLQQLQSAVQNQVQGEMIELPPLREDEIGFLGQTLQQKWLELATLTQTLEQKVSDRTEEWRQSQDFLQSLLDYLPVALFVKNAKVDHFGEIVLWNPKSEQLFGLTNQEVIGKTVFDLHSLEQAKLFDQADRECVASKTLINIAEETIDSYLNGRIYLHTIKVPLLNQQGEPEYLLCISEDITARKIAEDNLFALNQELEVRI